EVNYQNGYASDNLPLYPFGYGLSYTNYEYADFKINSKAKTNGKRFMVSFTVQNTGQVDGEEIVQLYVSPKNKNSTMKSIQLKGFERVSLKVGEKKKVIFAVSPQQLVQYKNQQWIVEEGVYTFKVGASSTDIKLQGDVKFINGDFILENGRQVFFSQVK
ncbi:fibronectin type III-like domain-contianing protein, partial [Flavicella sp.]|uniref:fibronectin type III-like domain-contianing protein n=1 Tax=Flavicella sp. TaxID=2957742 RepID=UPI00261CA87C